MVSSPVCGFRNLQAVDDIIHRFYKCQCIKNFWISLEKWWNRVSSCQVLITDKHILCGLYYDNVYYRQINFVILLSKVYIQDQRIKCKNVDFYDFLSFLKSELGQEMYICNLNNDNNFDTRWGDIYRAL